MPDLDADAIAANATTPQSAGVDGQTAAQVPIPDQITAHRYKAANAAAAGTNANGGKRSGWGALRAARAAPGGPV